MSLKRDREPVEVLANPVSACSGFTPKWYKTRRYVIHRDSFLTWRHPSLRINRTANPENWRKVKA